MLDIEILSINSITGNCSSWLFLTEFELLRAKSFLKIHDSLRFKLGRLMVRTRLSKELGLMPDKVPILITHLGKPICSIENSLEFSISHSGSFVAVGWSDFPIGVDIEPLTSILDPNSDNLIFNSREINFLINSEINNNIHRLILFVAKEAVLKCLGLGFSVDPRLVELKEYEKPWRIVSASYLNNIIFVKIISLPSGYMLGVASHSLETLVS
jgi:4'-phosphopantetheinyl transferase